MNRRRRTARGVPPRKEVNQKAPNVSFVDEHRSGNESITLSASRDQTSRWATTEELAHILDDGETETKDRLSAPEASASLNSRDAPYLDRFDTSPACVPVLTFAPPISTETLSSVGGDNKYTVDACGLETLQTPE